MTKWSIIIFLTFLSFGALSQDYFVLHVKGKVTESRTGKLLKPNDALKPNDKIIFSSKEDALAVVSSKSGRFILKPVSSKKNNEFVSIVKDILLPGSSKLSTRSGDVFKNVVDFKTYFSDPVLLLTSMNFKIDTIGFPLSNNEFFFIRYQYGGSSINKKLSYKNETVLIVRDELFRIDGARVNEGEVSNFSLFYMQNGNSQKISEMSLQVPDLDTLKEETAVIKRVSSEANYKEEVWLHFMETYGKIGEDDFKKWIKGVE